MCEGKRYFHARENSGQELCGMSWVWSRVQTIESLTGRTPAYQTISVSAAQVSSYLTKGTSYNGRSLQNWMSPVSGRSCRILACISQILQNTNEFRHLARDAAGLSSMPE